MSRELQIDVSSEGFAISPCRVELPALPFPFFLDGQNALAFTWMQTLTKRQPVLRNIRSSSVRLGFLAAACVSLVAGCASPGPPLPPSLKLPQPVTGLTAVRTGEQVVLHWTTPARTTDRLLIAGPVTAAICRERVTPAAMATPPSRAQPVASSGTLPCNVVLRVPVSPGPSQAADLLPASLTSGAADALAYRVWLLNSAGRTAGPSVVAYAASGPSPAPVTGLHASSTKPGVVLEWDHAPQTASITPSGDLVELDRVSERSTAPPSTPAGPAAPAEAHFRAPDTGGAIDRTAQAGQTYRYTVQRVRQVSLGGTALQVRGEPSPSVLVAVLSAFPAESPAGLIAAPGFAAGNKVAIDLTWEPDMEPHIAGYKLYRRQGQGDWQPLTSQPIRVTAYTDGTVTPGERYVYRVTAISDTGLESQPSAETAQTAASR